MTAEQTRLLAQEISDDLRLLSRAYARQGLIGAGAGLLFKGGGFYITDYRSEGYKQAAKKDTTPAKSESKPEAKPAAKPASKTEKK